MHINYPIKRIFAGALRRHRRSHPFLRRIIPLSSVSPDDPTALHNVPQRNDRCGSRLCGNALICVK